MGCFGFVFGPDGAGPYSALNNEGICRDALRRVRIHGGLIEPALPVFVGSKLKLGRARHPQVSEALRRGALAGRILYSSWLIGLV